MCSESLYNYQYIQQNIEISACVNQYFCPLAEPPNRKHKSLRLRPNDLKTWVEKQLLINANQL